MKFFDKPFEYNKLSNEITEINDEILLNFYALKMFTQLGTRMRNMIGYKLDHSEQVRNKLYKPKIQNRNQKNLSHLNKKSLKEIEHLKSGLNTICNCLCDSYQSFCDHYSKIVRIEFQQIFQNLNEKLHYFKIKFKSFVIEVDTLLSNHQYQIFDELLIKILPVFIEFFVSRII